MDQLKPIAQPIGRILLGLLFAVSGWGKILGGASFGGYIETKLPGMGFLAWPVSVFEFVGGVALIVGFKTRITALALAIFCILTALIFHGFVDQFQFTQTLKNLALAGGYLMLFVYGAGRWSIDNR